MIDKQEWREMKSNYKHIIDIKRGNNGTKDATLDNSNCNNTMLGKTAGNIGDLKAITKEV